MATYRRRGYSRRSVHRYNRDVPQEVQEHFIGHIKDAIRRQPGLEDRLVRTIRLASDPPVRDIDDAIRHILEFHDVQPGETKTARLVLRHPSIPERRYAIGRERIGWGPYGSINQPLRKDVKARIPETIARLLRPVHYEQRNLPGL